LIRLAPAPGGCSGAGAAMRDGLAARRAVPTRASPPPLFPSSPSIRPASDSGRPAAQGVPVVALRA
jgi:hypothetical protein